MSTPPARPSSAPRGGLARSFLLVILALALGPLLVVALLLYRQAEVEITSQVNAKLNAQLVLKQQQIELWASQRVSDLNNLATAPDILTAAQTLTTAPALSALANRLDNFVAANPDFKSLVVVAANGQVVAASAEGQTMLGASLQAEGFWITARFEPLFAPPRYDPRMNEQAVSLLAAAPIIVAEQGTLAVLVGVLRDTPLLKIIVPVPGLGATGQAYAITGDGYQLGARIAPGISRPRSEGITRALEDHRGGSDVYVGRDGYAVVGHYTWLEDLRLALLIEQSTTEAFAPITQALNIVLAVIAGAVILSLLVSVFFTRRLTGPIVALTDSVTRLASGDLNTRVNIVRRDELGVLADAFNQMSDDLRVSYRTLQTTAEARARQLAVTAEMSRAAAASQGQEALLARVADLIQRHFNLDFVFIFLLDESGQFAVLREATDTGPGRELKAGGFRVAVGASSIVGWVAENKTPRVTAQVRDDAMYLPHSRLPDVQSEAAFPLLVGERVIGVLDLQSHLPNAFAAADIEVLQTAADQLAVATENNRLFARQQRVLQLEDLVISLTGKIHQTLNPENILESAALDLGRAFGARRAVVRLFAPQPTDAEAPADDQPHNGNGQA